MTLLNNILCILTWSISPILCREVVLTKNGLVRGKLVDEFDVRFFSYQGLPYAEAPIGDLRFAPPVPKSPWIETFDATKQGPECPQPVARYRRDENDRRHENEDCLILNVYVPAVKCKEYLPVFVYIHGGEAQSLSGNPRFIYGPQLLMQRDIVLVTINYRLGVLGFLSLDIQGATGNTGIKDCLLALHWVNENIKKFGGDPKQITLGGNSAGAVITQYLLLSKRPTGLFQRAILISGTAFSYRFQARHAKHIANKLAEELGIDTKDSYEVLQKLKPINAFELVAAAQRLGQNDTRKGLRTFSPFVPNVEIEYPNAIITQDPLKIINEGIPQNVPILVGFNSQEGIKMIPDVQEDPGLIEYLNKNFELCIPSDIEYPYGSEKSLKLVSDIRKLYFNNGNITNATIDGFVALGRDSPFSYPIDVGVKLHKENDKSNKVFYYVLNYDGGLNWFKLFNDVEYPGTAHNDEVGYIFVTNATKSKIDELDARDKTMIDVMLTYFTNFIKFGDPSPNGTNVYTKWLETTKEGNYLLLNDNPQNIPGRPTPTYLEFWTKVYEEYYA